MARILIISPEFYPENTGGSHRPFRMAQYFSKSHDVIVLTKTLENLKKYDLSLQQKLDNSNFRTIRASLKCENWYSKLSSKYYFNIVDDFYKRWSSNAFCEISNLYKEEHIDHVIITCPPFSVSTFVHSLKKRWNSEIILDMRDAWSQWNVFPYASKLHYLLTLKTEKKTLNNADQIWVTSKVTQKDFIALHGIEENKFSYVPNSFDKYSPSKFSNSSNEISIGYVGSFYYAPKSEEFTNSKWYERYPHKWFQYVPEKEFWRYRTPYYFFKALRQCIDRNSLQKRVLVNFAGEKPDWLVDMVNEFELNDVVNFHGKMNKTEVIEFQGKQDFLLMTSSKKEINKDYSVAGKTFEYFSLCKPIISFVAKSEQRDLLSKVGHAYCIDPDSKDIALKLKEILEIDFPIKIDSEQTDKFLTKNVLNDLFN